MLLIQCLSKMEDILLKVKPIGPYQAICILVCGLSASLHAITAYSTIFTTAEPEIVCHYTNSSNETSHIIDDPLETCTIWFNETRDDEIKCAFENTYYGNTIATEWKLICNKRFLVSLTQTFFLVGSVSSLFTGYIGDRYGRKRSLLFFTIFLSSTILVTQILFLNALNISIAIKYIIYCAGQLIIGISVQSIYSFSYVLLLEFTIEKYHVLFAILKVFIYVIGEFLIMIVAYFFRD